MQRSEISDYRFPPSRTLGLLVHIPLLLLLSALDVGGFIFFSRQEPGLLFFVSLLISVFLLVPVFFIGYRTFALIFSSYALERDGFHINWGLRREVIPLSEIEWIRTPKEMPFDVPWSFLPMPGAYLGKVQSENYPLIEFIASDVMSMLFIGTSRCIYAVSPAKPRQFIETFTRVLQLGTLSEIEWQTIRPVDWIAESWKNRSARLSVQFSLVLITILFLWIGFRFSGRQTIELGYSAAGAPQEILPVRNVLILPVLTVLFWLSDLGIGIRLYQYQNTRQLAEIFWGGSVIITFLFVLSAIFIL